MAARTIEFRVLYYLSAMAARTIEFRVLYYRIDRIDSRSQSDASHSTPTWTVDLTLSVTVMPETPTQQVFLPKGSLCCVCITSSTSCNLSHGNLLSKETIPVEEDRVEKAEDREPASKNCKNVHEKTE